MLAVAWIASPSSTAALAANVRRSRSAEDIARSVDSIGGNLDAFTAKEMVCYNTKVLDQHLFQAFEVLSDLVLHPRFLPEDLQGLNPEHLMA